MFFPFLFLLLSCTQALIEQNPAEIEAVMFEDHSYIQPVSFPRHPIKHGNWENVPAVYICPNTPISTSRVSRAMSVWKRQGYEMYGPFTNIDLPACRGEEDFSWGNIIIDLRGQSFPEDMLAVTRTYRRTEDSTIVAAVIKIQSFADEKERTIEHELGHAFGWRHFNRRYHMMNSIHEQGGWDMHGLRRPRR
mgnify:CR=1 FL=1|tara:strand:+ start:1460 stop:2035 length:576 start_codon:yes stop_codon:yes gene_type:complete